MRPSFWKMNEIIDIVRDGEKKTAICIGRDDFGLPKHLMQGTKQDGIISDGHSLSSWYWDGLCVIEGKGQILLQRNYDGLRPQAVGLLPLGVQAEI